MALFWSHLFPSCHSCGPQIRAQILSTSYIWRVLSRQEEDGAWEQLFSNSQIKTVPL
ncbi:rCG46411 [Rattus norvegicus]|uniref:RCG46411 n=1 Tax=Rattus norvegicus TaxID=10116 RepID=A6IC05_RAT|nr:rCG46411 [Rattus norvegicus]